MPKLIVPAVAALLLSALAFAGEPTGAAKAELAADPYTRVLPELAPDKELLAKIEALPDNTWLKLPPVKTAGELAWCGKPECPGSEKMLQFGPGLRDYSLKMVWAADRKRALFCGTNHGTFPITNDVWEYDLASNTWVCLFGSDPSVFNSPAEFYQKNAVMKDGVVQTPRGGILRPPHTWSGLTYDNDRHKMIWLLPRGGRGCTFVNQDNLAKGLGFKDKDELNKAWRKGPWVNYAWAYTYWWTYDPYTGKGEMLTDGIPKGWEGDSLEYIPDQKQIWSSLGAQMYDPDKKVTIEPKPKGKAAGVGEVVAAYDPESKTIVMLSQNKTNVYSFATNEWKVAQDNAIASGVDMRSFFCYDLVARKFVLNTIDKGPKGENKPGLYLYDLARNEWDEAKPQGDAAPNFGGGYYDPERNVTVSYTGREVYVYRGKRAAKQERK